MHKARNKAQPDYIYGQTCNVTVKGFGEVDQKCILLFRSWSAAELNLCFG